MASRHHTSRAVLASYKIGILSPNWTWPALRRTSERAHESGICDPIRTNFLFPSESIVEVVSTSKYDPMYTVPTDKGLDVRSTGPTKLLSGFRGTDDGKSCPGRRPGKEGNIHGRWTPLPQPVGCAFGGATWHGIDYRLQKLLRQVNFPLSPFLS